VKDAEVPGVKTEVPAEDHEVPADLSRRACRGVLGLNLNFGSIFTRYFECFSDWYFVVLHRYFVVLDGGTPSFLTLTMSLPAP
jgi:hypothetical protein